MLLLLNLLPLFGVIYWHWTIFYVIYLYWFESLLLSFFTALKILFAKGTVSYRDNSPWQALTKTPANTVPRSHLRTAIGYFIKRVMMLLFYLLFIVVFAGIVLAPKETMLSTVRIMVFADAGFNRVILAFILSQVLDFGYNYILNKENEYTHPYDLAQMFDTRTVVMHVVIVVGGVLCVFAEKYLGGDGNSYSAYAYVAVFVIVKSVADRISYGRERKRAELAKDAGFNPAKG